MSFKFFSNTGCVYFPCHKAAENEPFNCMFCYCPLYLLGRKCGGDFEYIGKDKNIKDCSSCVLPHKAEYYDIIVEKLKNI